MNLLDLYKHNHLDPRELIQRLAYVGQFGIKESSNLLYMHPQSLSQSLRKLEDRVGGKLYVRPTRNRPLVLTELGHQVVELLDD